MKKGHVIAGSVTDRILLALEADGGWLTPGALEMEADASQVAVSKSIKRLLDHGRIERRKVLLASHRGGGQEVRTEYRVIIE